MERVSHTTILLARIIENSAARQYLDDVVAGGVAFVLGACAADRAAATTRAATLQRSPTRTT